jgi:hypothetical protein
MSDGVENDAASQAPLAGDHGEPCPGCQRILPIRLQRHGELAAHWECAACRAPLTGVLLKELALKMGETIRIGRAHFDMTGAAPIPSSLRHLVNEFVDRRRRSTPSDQRRKAPRVPQELDVTVLKLDDHWMPRDKPLAGLAVDLSPHGLGVVTAAAIDGQFAAVQFRLPAGVAQILGRIVWTKDLGHGFFSSGLQFLLRFGRGPTAVERSHPAL